MRPACQRILNRLNGFRLPPSLLFLTTTHCC
jgi:hypothetical protein